MPGPDGGPSHVGPQPSPEAATAPTVTELDQAAGRPAPPKLAASVKKLEGQMTTLPGSPSQLYSIDLWVAAPADELRRIEEVTYNLSRYYRVKPRLQSSDEDSGFRVTTVPLWGCVGSVLVSIKYEQGPPRELVFDWCRAANWEGREL
jgi:hypothetical protein